MAKGKKRPTRDEFELEQIGEQLVEAKHEGTKLLLDVWEAEAPIQGRITELDSRTKLVHVSSDGAVIKVPFMDIMRVSNAR